MLKRNILRTEPEGECVGLLAELIAAPKLWTTYQILCFETLKWRDSLLWYRIKRVVVTGETLELAPIFFWCLTGDRSWSNIVPVVHKCHFHWHWLRNKTDDSVCYREIRDAEDSLELQKDTDRLECWARKWGMRFQPDKCNILHITRERINNTLLHFRGNGPRKRDSIEYLGVTITLDLRRWSQC